MIPPRIQAALDDAGVRYCLIGAHALAVYGVARYTADIDLLTLDAAVMDAGFWPQGLAPTVRRGDAEDPLAGLVRFGSPALDLIVGRGPVMRGAVQDARPEALMGCPVVTPFWLALLKLEAGGVQDLADVQLLFEARRRAGDALRQEVADRLDLLSEWGQRAWTRVAAAP